MVSPQGKKKRMTFLSLSQKMLAMIFQVNVIA
jgi:hypothetical protein